MLPENLSEIMKFETVIHQFSTETWNQFNTSLYGDIVRDQSKSFVEGSDRVQVCNITVIDHLLDI